MISTSAILLGAASVALAQSGTWPEGVQGTGTMGVTNPTAAVENTPLNQTSESRLLTLNSIDDFCIFAPPTPQIIADSETIEVAWCTKPRNNARLIPDGTLQGVSFLKTDMYVQIMAYGDFTKINIPYGDMGGELDPHGAYGAGNPIGGNVTTTVTPNGQELNVGEWMQFVSYQQVCLRACTNANSTYSAAQMCEHKLDEVGCNFVMPGNYNFNGTFETCEADVAYPPGLYPTATVNGVPQFSTFAQFFTGVYTANGTPVSYTVGTTVTPEGAYSTPSSSNCKTVTSIANGNTQIAAAATGAAGSGSASGGAAATGSASGTGAKQTGVKATSAADSKGSSGANPSSTGGSSGAMAIFPGMGALAGLTIASVLAVASGAVMVL
jgi:hypothetical protein